MSGAVKILHIATLGLYLLVTYILQIENPQNAPKSHDPTVRTMGGFSRRFLTNWTFTLQAIYLMISVMAHFLSIFKFSQKTATKFYSTADYIFTSISTPMAFLVSIVFWVLYTIDRELVYPKALDAVIPVWVNHSIHTFNSILAIADMSLMNHKFSSWGSSLKGLLTYLVIYSVCLFGTYFQTGIWLYPVLKEMNWAMRVAFAVGNIILSISTFALTKGINKLLWGDAVPERNIKRSIKKKK